jgi:hypothetical protein
MKLVTFSENEFSLHKSLHNISQVHHPFSSFYYWDLFFEEWMDPFDNIMSSSSECLPTLLEFLKIKRNGSADSKNSYNNTYYMVHDLLASDPTFCMSFIPPALFVSQPILVCVLQMLHIYLNIFEYGCKDHLKSKISVDLVNECKLSVFYMLLDIIGFFYRLESQMQKKDVDSKVHNKQTSYPFLYHIFKGKLETKKSSEYKSLLRVLEENDSVFLPVQYGDSKEGIWSSHMSLIFTFIHNMFLHATSSSEEIELEAGVRKQYTLLPNYHPLLFPIIYEHLFPLELLPLVISGVSFFHVSIHMVDRQLFEIAKNLRLPGNIPAVENSVRVFASLEEEEKDRLMFHVHLVCYLSREYPINDKYVVFFYFIDFVRSLVNCELMLDCLQRLDLVSIFSSKFISTLPTVLGVVADTFPPLRIKINNFLSTLTSQEFK